MLAIGLIAVFALFLFMLSHEGFFVVDNANRGGEIPNNTEVIPNLPVVNLPRPIGIFEYPNANSDYIDLIGPGDFEYIENDGNWYLISADSGNVWIDLTFWPSIDILQDFFNSFPHPVSVYYQNLDTGFSFGHRDGINYFSASLNKASFALYVYHLAEQGLADLNRIHTYRQGERREGTGQIWRRYGFGRQFTHLELLRYSVMYSDNTAHQILERIYGNHTPSYWDFYRSIGGNVSLVPSISGHRMTASEAALIMRNINDYFETETEYAVHFQYSMLNSDVPKITARYPIAQKYGGWDDVFHDMGIIYAPSPYILTILTSLFDMQPFGIFDEISQFIQDFNDRYFRTE